MPNILKLEFLSNKPADLRTLQERTADRVAFHTDINFAKSYAVFFLSFVLLSYLVAALKTDTRSELDILKQEICDTVPESPLCIHPDPLIKLDAIATQHGISPRLLTGIYFAESRLWTHFSKPACASYHNWWWMKWKKSDQSPAVFYQADRSKPDANGCWLYEFESFEEATTSLAKTLSLWFKWCFQHILEEEQTKCISYAYVGNPSVAEQSWINRVSQFYPTTHNS